MGLERIERWENLKGYHSQLVLDKTEDLVYLVMPVPPTRRDLWTILRGHYKPQLRLIASWTLRGVDKRLKEFYNEPIRRELNQENLFLKAEDQGEDRP